MRGPSGRSRMRGRTAVADAEPGGRSARAGDGTARRRSRAPSGSAGNARGSDGSTPRIVGTGRAPPLRARRPPRPVSRARRPPPPRPRPRRRPVAGRLEAAGAAPERRGAHRPGPQIVQQEVAQRPVVAAVMPERVGDVAGSAAARLEPRERAGRHRRGIGRALGEDRHDAREHRRLRQVDAVRLPRDPREVLEPAGGERAPVAPEHRAAVPAADVARHARDPVAVEVERVLRHQRPFRGQRRLERADPHDIERAGGRDVQRAGGRDVERAGPRRDFQRARARARTRGRDVARQASRHRVRLRRGLRHGHGLGPGAPGARQRDEEGRARAHPRANSSAARPNASASTATRSRSAATSAPSGSIGPSTRISRRSVRRTRSAAALISASTPGSTRPT